VESCSNRIEVSGFQKTEVRLLLLIPHDRIWLYLIVPFVAVFQGLTQPNGTAIISNIANKDKLICYIFN